jgi:hypothetical protein
MIKFIRIARRTGKSWREIWDYLVHQKNFEPTEQQRKQSILDAILSEVSNRNLIVEYLLGPPGPIADFGGCWRL